ncbi:hypothetical protein [Phaeodactylibacter luteus]|uniref:Uncharacterized protein n=1 Tax=Phaeodactylibacter luteus TaxID=1564516 RepID=A0A5C6RG61_9BACT|nr:hypothetical protein [Phaeodactylibacter luteus]TXB61418.1 hypothetical protein FRY97_19185 [Phaeodactylibacter luteus]
MKIVIVAFGYISPPKAPDYKLTAKPRIGYKPIQQIELYESANNRGANQREPYPQADEGSLSGSDYCG